MKKITVIGKLGVERVAPEHKAKCRTVGASEKLYLSGKREISVAESNKDAGAQEDCQKRYNENAILEAQGSIAAALLKKYGKAVARVPGAKPSIDTKEMEVI